MASLEKTIEDMHKTFLDFTTKAISSGIEIGAPALARQLKSTAVKLAELAKSSADDSDGKENKKDPSSSTQAPVGERQNRRPLRASETEPVSMLGYEVTHSEEEEDEEDDNGEIAPTNPIPAAQLDSNLPPLDWTTTETVQQLQDKAPAASLHGLDAISLVKAHLSELPENIPENRFEQYLRRQGLYLDHQYFVVEVPELDEQTASLSEMQKFSENSQRSSSRGSKGARRTPQDAELDWPFESLLYSGVNFWSGNTKIPSTPDVDMEFEFNDCRYSKGKSFGPSQNLIVGSPKYGLNRGNYHRLGVEENDVKVSEEGHVECELGSH